MKIIILVILVTSSLVHADGDKVEEARTHFKNGADLYDENNFRGALVEFQRAYDLSPSYKILYNIGLVEMELQDYAGALKAYTRYLKEGGPDIPADRVTSVNAEIERLKGRIGQVTIQTVSGAEVLLDDVQAGFSPLPGALPVNIGRHTIMVRPPGKEPVSRVIDVAGQQQLTVAIANDLTAPAGVLGQTGTKPPSRTPMYVAWSATGVLAIAGGVFGVLAISHARKLDDLRNSFPVTQEQLDAEAKSQTTTSYIADGLGIAAVVAGSIALYLTLGRDYSTPAVEKKTAQLRVGPMGAYVVGRF